MPVKKNEILVALIGAVAVVAAALIAARCASRPGSPEPKQVSKTGRVLDANSGRPIANAKVSIEQDQQVPQIHNTDSEGIFHLTVPESANSIRLRVEADKYIITTRNVPITRTGIEEIKLPPMPAPSPDSLHFNFLKDKPSLEEVRYTIAEGQGVSIRFNRNCTQTIKTAKVELNGAQLDGTSIEDVLLKARDRAHVNFNVEKVGDGSYMINCK
jgi:hypothetical protein